MGGSKVGSMNSQTIYKIHKWLAVSVGGFFLVWLISGIVMILPRLSADPEGPPISDVIDMKKVSLSAQEAVTKLTTQLGEVPQVREVSLKRIADNDVYEVLTASHGPHLIDARFGEPFRITAQGAEAIAKRRVAPGAGVLQIELLSRREFTYREGPLPVYRIVFEQDPSVLYYVSVRDGTVSRSDRESRIRSAIASMHTLEPVKLLMEREAFRKGLLLLSSLIGIAAVGTGFYLAWPSLRRQPAVAGRSVYRTER
jgi:uncharacterized iron-regulated membrane protein